jgi:hypothetical protein
MLPLPRMAAARFASPVVYTTGIGISEITLQRYHLSQSIVEPTHRIRTEICKSGARAEGNPTILAKTKPTVLVE